MEVPLLATKLYTPPPRSNRVSRPRLLGQLDEGLRLGRRLTLVSAPAGSGKTTLLAEWSRRGSRPSAWLALDAGDNDPAQFLSYLIAALQQANPRIGRAAQQILHSPQALQSAPQLSLMTLVINDVTAVGGAITLVLDDYHVISAAPVHDLLQFLVEHQPAPLHLVIITREDPPVPLPRLRARDQVTEIRERDLRFTAEEAAAFLTQTMGLQLSAGAVAALEARTEGWIAALQLAALSMRGRADVADFIASFTGSNRYVFDYLVEEVLARQSPEMQRFLLLTSVLDRMTGPLCDALTGRDDGQATLEALEQANLFIVPLDQDRTWYRYHHLFAQFLRGRLRQDASQEPVSGSRAVDAASLHRRASEWHERHGLPAEAIEHALAAQDFERAAHLIEGAAPQALVRGETSALLRWMEALPEMVIDARPYLCLAHAWALVMAGRHEAAKARVTRALNTIANPIDIQGEAAAIRAVIAGLQHDASGSIELAHQALAQLPVEDRFLRGLVTLGLAVAYDMRGDLAAASQAYTEALGISRTTGNFVVGLMATNQLGDLKMAQGRLREAADLYRQAVRVTAEPGRQLPIAGTVYLSLSQVLYEWNDLDGASSHLATAMELGHQWQSLDILASGSVFEARVRQARGDEAAARALVRKADEALRGDIVSPTTVNVAQAYEARLLLLQGDLDAAEELARKYAAHPGDVSGLQRGVEAATWARVLIARTRTDEALQWLDVLLSASQAAGMLNAVIECHVLRALALHARGDHDKAAAELLTALTQSEPERHIRTFVDEGPAMERILRRISEQRRRGGPSPAYVEAVLAGFSRNSASESRRLQAATEGRLVEPLSEREMDVLRLLAAGLSNPDIARELIIEVSTVRSHVKSIYGKLDAHSRYEAIERARALRFLE